MKKILLVALVLSVLALSVCANNQEGDIVKVVIKTSKGNIELELDKSMAPIGVENFVGLAMGTKEFTDPKTNELTKGHFYDGLIFHRVIKDFMIQGGCPLGNGTGGPGYKFVNECYKDGERLTGVIEDEHVAYQVYTNILLPYMQETEEDRNPEIQEILDEIGQRRSGRPLFGKEIERIEELTGRGPVYKREFISKVDYGTICYANSGPDTNGSQFFIVTKKEGCNWLNGGYTVFGKVTKGMEVAHAIEDVEKNGEKPIEDVKIISIRVK
ncbi:MAG: peptidylprolyl isomerase [Candidatus Cloacimonetes bacterium]|nr:peptidylprolyl isomerase [Candidatus Cloacimonadota bacterium]